VWLPLRNRQQTTKLGIPSVLVLYNNLDEGIGPPTLKTWLRPWCIADMNVDVTINSVSCVCTGGRKEAGCEYDTYVEEQLDV